MWDLRVASAESAALAQQMGSAACKSTGKLRVEQTRWGPPMPCNHRVPQLPTCPPCTAQDRCATPEHVCSCAVIHGWRQANHIGSELRRAWLRLLRPGPVWLWLLRRRRVWRRQPCQRLSWKPHSDGTPVEQAAVHLCIVHRSRGLALNVCSSTCTWPAVCTRNAAYLDQRSIPILHGCKVHNGMF